jgi:hypothetical protein
MRTIFIRDYLLEQEATEETEKKLLEGVRELQFRQPPALPGDSIAVDSRRAINPRQSRGLSC